MKKNSFGKIVNISSVGGGINVFPGFNIADGMSKAAIAFMTKQMAAESIYDKVEIFAVCPGATDTDMFRASTLDSLTETQKAELTHSLPKEELINPDQIADVVRFLCTDEAKILHGAVIDASNGLGVNPSALYKRRES
jgi:NAD(P)-dependent dehydrogenase (short-subunit alcohol dehydrogenase family)